MICSKVNVNLVYLRHHSCSPYQVSYENSCIFYVNNVLLHIINNKINIIHDEFNLFFLSFLCIFSQNFSCLMSTQKAVLFVFFFNIKIYFFQYFFYHQNSLFILVLKFWMGPWVDEIYLLFFLSSINNFKMDANKKSWFQNTVSVWCLHVLGKRDVQLYSTVHQKIIWFFNWWGGPMLRRSYTYKIYSYFVYNND